jgi:hypothetical protein
MGIVFEFQAVKVENYWGGCPACGKAWSVNVETDDTISENWFVCSTHRVKWLAGTNLFTNVNTAEQEQENRTLLANCREVMPVDEGVVVGNALLPEGRSSQYAAT